MEIKDGEAEISLYGLEFSPAGELLLAAGYSSKKVWLVDTKTGKLRHTLNHGHYIQQYSFHPKQAVNSAPAHEVALFQIPSGKRERIVAESMLPIHDHAWILKDRAIALWTNQMLHVERLDNGRKLFIRAISPSEGTCTAAVFDDRGHFDGPAEGFIAFRLGDNLREAAMIQNGPTFEALRSSTVVSDFLGDL